MAWRLATMALHSSSPIPRGLLFPASIVLSRGSIFVTNLALDLTEAVGDEPEEDVETYTVSRIRLGFHD
jgi:hypothetical protein